MRQLGFLSMKSSTVSGSMDLATDSPTYTSVTPTPAPAELSCSCSQASPSSREKQKAVAEPHSGDCFLPVLCLRQTGQRASYREGAAAASEKEKKNSALRNDWHPAAECERRLNDAAGGTLNHIHVPSQSHLYMSLCSPKAAVLSKRAALARHGWCFPNSLPLLSAWEVARRCLCSPW